MSMGMQSFLSTTTELRACGSELPPEVVAALAAKGWPALRSATKTEGELAHGETFLIEFSSPPPANLAPIGPHGDRTRAVLHIIGAQLGASPIFATQFPASNAVLQKALALAKSAGRVTPHVWMTGEIARRGALRQLQYALLESVTEPSAQAALSVSLPASLPADALTGLPYYPDAFALLAELRRLAVGAGATELDAPLARLATACRDEWHLQSAAPTLLLSGGGGTGAAASGSIWASAVVCDARLVDGEGAPWDLLRAACHVVKVRWLIDLLRRTPGVGPRCEMGALLAAHDAGQVTVEWLG